MVNDTRMLALLKSKYAGLNAIYGCLKYVISLRCD